MTGALLLRGMLAGLAAGLVAFAFAWVFGEPQVAVAIAFEAHRQQMAGTPPEPELVSRAVQSTIGLLTGTVVYGSALGGIFALAFAGAYGRIGRLSPRATAAILAAAGFVVLVLAPQIKYPANPPSVGEPATIGARTALYFAMILFSVIASVAALLVGRYLADRLGAWNAALLGGAAYLAAIAIAMQILPAVDEVPSGFSAVALWRFRLAGFGIHAVLWTTLGLVLGRAAEPLLQRRARGMARQPA